MRHKLHPAGFPSTKQHGFSMVEVLITLVIVATALFGTAGLQVYAMRMNQGGQFRTQAVFIASDIAERMEANKAAAVAGNYAVASTSTASVPAADCAQAVCDPANLANWDISQWETSIVNLSLPQASWQITQTTAGNPSTYDIIIRWTDRRADTTYAAYNATSPVGLNAVGTSEVFSYTATRTISN